MKNIFLLLILFLANFVYAQGQANNWYFGEYAGLSFNSLAGASVTLVL